MDLEPLATKHSRHWIYKDDLTKNLSVEADLGIIVAPNPNGASPYASEYFVASFGTEQKSLALTIAEELKK